MYRREFSTPKVFIVKFRDSGSPTPVDVNGSIPGDPMGSLPKGIPGHPVLPLYPLCAHRPLIQAYGSS